MTAFAMSLETVVWYTAESGSNGLLAFAEPFRIIHHQSSASAEWAAAEMMNAASKESATRTEVSARAMSASPLETSVPPLMSASPDCA